MSRSAPVWPVLGIIGLIALLLASCTQQPPDTPTITPLAPTPSDPPLPSPTPQPTPTVLPPTPAPSATPTPTLVPLVRFAVIGDYGLAGPDLAAVAALVDSWGVDLILTTGDNNYPVGSPATIDDNIGQYFHHYIHPYQGDFGAGSGENRFFPTLGNHDWMWQDARPYLDYFALPGNERYYTFRWEFIDFFALSSDWAEPDGITPGSVQGEWLQTALSNSTSAWQVVYFHHAPYSSGYHGPTSHMQWPFDEWGVDAVFSGHDHHYERLSVDGLTYIVQGLSGGAIYAFYDIDPGSQVRYNQTYGALLVEATPDEIWFGFYTVDGDLVDDYTLGN